MDTQATEKKERKPLSKKKLILLIAIAAALVIAGVVTGVLTSRYVASTARLLRTEGTVCLSAEDGSEKSLAENMRFRSGNALRTESRSLASIGLDASKIVTMNENSRAEFLKQGKKIRLHLTDGRLFFQVSRKLADDESFDIRTSTMVVGIRGTSGYVSVDEDGHERVYVTDGTVHIVGTNPVTGEVKEIDLHAGERVTVYLFNDKEKDSIMFFIEKVESESHLPSLITVSLAEDKALMEKVCGETGWQPSSLQTLAETYNGKGADEGVNVPVDTSGQKVMDGALIVIADSAARVYDGTPLTAPGFRVEGLEDGYQVSAHLSGSLTDAGTLPNRVEDLKILSPDGEDASGRFLNVILVDGTLTVQPLPILIETGSADKVYDGMPLTADSYSLFAFDESFVATAAVTEGTPGTDRAFVCADADGNEAMWVLTGSVRLIAVNPLTRESVSTVIAAPRVVRIELYGDREEDSLLFASEEIDAAALPEEAIRHIASDKALLAQMTDEALFDPDALEERIRVVTAPQAGVLAGRAGEDEEEDDDFIQCFGIRGSGCFLIRVSGDASQFRGRPLTDGEAKLIVPARAALPEVTVTGSRTDAGESENLCEIKWDELDETNFKPEVTYGTLRIDPLAITVTTEGATKEYDGTPLTAPGVTAEPALPKGVTLTASGSRTDAGTSENTFTVDWGDVNGGNYRFVEQLGSLTVDPAVIRVSTGSATMTYNGSALTSRRITLTGAPEGVTASATGSQTNPGTSQNGYTIDWGDVNSDNYRIEEDLGSLTVNRIPVTVTTGSASGDYTGKALTNATASITGAPAGVTVTATGSQTDAGSSKNTYTINWNGVDSSKYAVTENLGTLTVKPLVFTVTTPSAVRTYAGTALQTLYVAPTLSGNVPPGATAVCTGSQTNAGTSLNTYRINWNGNNPANYTVVENLGTLRVDPVPIQVWSGSANDVVTGSPLTNPSCGINGWNGEGITVRATGSQLNEGTSVNTVEINWNGANPANYAVTYNLGTLTVGH